MNVTATQAELEAGRGYEALFVPALFGPWAKHLVDGASVEDGSHVLDIACGTGVLARHVYARSGRSGRVVGVDPAPGMLAAAKEGERSIEWMPGTAEALPLDDATFDCVVSQFGMMFFKDRHKAAIEMLRVLKPGGRLALAVWNALEHNRTYAEMSALLDEKVGTDAGNAIRLPYSLGDPADIVGILKQAGFSDIVLETREEQARFPSTRTMVEAELRGWLPLFGISLSEEKIADLLIESDVRLSSYAAQSGEAVFPTSAHIVTARKPQ